MKTKHRSPGVVALPGLKLADQWTDFTQCSFMTHRPGAVLAWSKYQIYDTICNQNQQTNSELTLSFNL